MRCNVTLISSDSDGGNRQRCLELLGPDAAPVVLCEGDIPDVFAGKGVGVDVGSGGGGRDVIQRKVFDNRVDDGSIVCWELVWANHRDWMAGLFEDARAGGVRVLVVNTALVPVSPRMMRGLEAVHVKAPEGTWRRVSVRGLCRCAETERREEEGGRTVFDLATPHAARTIQGAAKAYLFRRKTTEAFANPHTPLGRRCVMAKFWGNFSPKAADGEC